MTPEQLKPIQARYEVAKEFIDLLANEPCLHDSACGYAVVDLPACLKEIQRLRKILETVGTKHTLLKALSEYPLCRCKPDSLCMKHAAIDILKMIALETGT